MAMGRLLSKLLLKFSVCKAWFFLYSKAPLKSCQVQISELGVTLNLLRHIANKLFAKLRLLGSHMPPPTAWWPCSKLPTVTGSLRNLLCSVYRLQLAALEQERVTLELVVAAVENSK